MKILITGGAGFIGSALIRYLIENTSHVLLNIDKLTYAGNVDALHTVSQHARYHFEKMDIASAQPLEQIFKSFQPDAVMHLAAETHVDRSLNGPEAFMHSNIMGTYTLLEAARHYWISLSDAKKAAFRFLHVSTDEVFGDLGDTGLYFTETTPYAPSSPYSASKASADHLVRAWHRSYGLPVLITNCSNNYGPWQHSEKFIPRMILNALQGKPMTLYGSGTQIRDWLYVDDHVRALYLVLTKAIPGSTYNIGGNHEKQNADIVREICDMLEVIAPEKPDGIKKYAQLITQVQDRPGHDVRYAMDISKIRNDLGWMPAESFRTGLEKTILWYIDNQIAIGQKEVTM